MRNEEVSMIRVVLLFVIFVVAFALLPLLMGCGGGGDSQEPEMTIGKPDCGANFAGCT